MELKPGLQRTGVLDVEATRRQAEEAGFATFVLPAEGIVDEASFYEAVRATLPTDPPLVSPEELARTGGRLSRDALDDSLWEGLYTHPARRIAILWPKAGTMSSSSPSDFEIALSVLTDVANLLADPRATVGKPKEVAVLVEDRTG